MENNDFNFLPQLKDSIPSDVFGYTVSMYSVALEGWRRGLTLKFINNNSKAKSTIKYSLTHESGRMHYFSVARGDAVPRSAIKICVNKDLTKDYLSKAGVPVPEGETFEEDVDDKTIVNYAEKLGYPLVLKPSDGTGGNGVIANIKNEDEFKQALDYVKYELNYKKLIVEKYIPGEDYRIYVIDNKVIAAFKKDPANVIGDGTNTIENLIRLKNEKRTKTPALKNRPIRVDRETNRLLTSNGYTMKSVPKKGEQVFLKTKNNVSAGGDSIDVTDELTSEICDIAIRAANAIPGLVQTGVDMMVDLKNNKGAVLELNSRPHITAHLYPIVGKSRDIPKAVIDYYFPETKQTDYDMNSLYYFDFNTVYDLFLSGICKEYQIPDVPKGKLSSTRFRISGVSGSLTYKKWIRRIVRSLDLHGYIKDLNNGETSVVISGLASSVDKFRDVITTEAPRNIKVKNIVEKTRKLPVEIGFEIIENHESSQKHVKDGYYPVRLPEHPSNNKRIERTRKPNNVTRTNEVNSIIKERDFYKKKYNELLKSSSWKLSKPIRFIGKLFK